MGYHQTDLSVSDFLRQRLFEKLEPPFARFLVSCRDLSVFFRRKPLGAELRLAGLNQLGDHIEHSAQLTAANLRNFFKGAALLQELQCFSRRMSRFYVPSSAGAFALREAPQRREDLLTIDFHFLVAETRNTPQRTQIRGFRQAERVQSRI